MADLPNFISITFIIITLLTIFVFLESAKQSRITLIICSGWLILQALIALSGFYTSTMDTPPRIMLGVVPVMIFILVVFNHSKGKEFIDKLDGAYLSLIHVMRIPVEVVLFWLYCEFKVPEIMTFEGRNFDILSGVSAPFIWYFGYVKNRLPKWMLIAWNFICLGLLLNIVGHAILSLPTSFQVFGIDQPNVAILYFPFIWLPTVVVPIVLFSHLALLRKLLIKRN